MSSQRTTRQPAAASAARLAARAAADAQAARKRRLQVGAVAAAAVLVLAAVAALAFGGGGSSGGTTGFDSRKESFRLPGLLDAKPVSLVAHAGKPVVVNFFASWCVYCNEELPGFVQVAKASAGRVDFIGVDTSDTGDGAAMARRFDLAGAGFSLARDIGAAPASELWSTFGSQGLPVTAFYDSHGKLVDFSGGMLTQPELQQRLKDDYRLDVAAPDAANLAAPVIPVIPQGAFELLRTHPGDPSFVALDVRTPAEFAAGHVPGAVNLNVESGDFAAQVARLDKGRNYFVYCHTGTRSAVATREMHQLGFKHIYDVQGGYQAWAQAGLPTTR